MACVTLKRPLELHHPGSSTPGFPTGPHHRGPPPAKRRRCLPVGNAVHRHREESRELLESGASASSSPFASSSSSSTGNASVFRPSPLSPSEIANNLRDELRRLKRRKQIAPYDPHHHKPGSPRSAPSSPEPMMDDATAVRTASGILANSSSSNVSSSARSENRPIFTLKQMSLICERMCKERTEQLRQEYDKILHQKLAEQYDAFVKFIDHQIQQRFNEAQLPSYLS